MTESVRVYVNARPIDVAAGATALDAVRALAPAVADQVTTGADVITDSRGLPIDASTVVAAGAIFRTVRSRGARESDPVES
jgi:hypothetical protein